MRRRLPAPRLALRPRERDPDVAAGVPVRPHLPGLGARRDDRRRGTTVLDDRVRAFSPGSRRRIARSERQGYRRSSAHGRSSRRPAASCSRSPLPGRDRGARGRGLAGLLDDLARGGRAGSRRPGRVARARSREDRRLAERMSPTRVSRNGRSSSRATRSRRCALRATSSISCFSTRRRTTTRRCSASSARSSTSAAWSSRTTSSRTPTRSPPIPPPARPTRRSSSVTLPLDRGLELTVALTEPF